MATYSIWANDRGFPQRVVPGTERPRPSDPATAARDQQSQAGITGSVVEPSQGFDTNCTRLLHTFEALDEAAANLRFVQYRDRGVELPRHGRTLNGELWRFRGTPCYLDVEGKRLGVSQVLTDRARLNPEIHRVSVLIAQLSERYRQLPKESYRAVASPPELASVRGTLAQAETEMAKLHALAAAAMAMIDDGYRAYGLEPPHRHFGVSCEFDDPIVRPGSNGQGEHGGGDAEAKMVKAEKKQTAGK